MAQPCISIREVLALARRLDGGNGLRTTPWESDGSEWNCWKPRGGGINDRREKERKRDREKERKREALVEKCDGGFVVVHKWWEFMCIVRSLRVSSSVSPFRDKNNRRTAIYIGRRGRGFFTNFNFDFFRVCLNRDIQRLYSSSRCGVQFWDNVAFSFGSFSHQSSFLRIWFVEIRIEYIPSWALQFSKFPWWRRDGEKFRIDLRKLVETIDTCVHAT